MNEARQFVIAIVRRLPLFLNFLIEGLSQLQRDQCPEKL